MPLSRNKTASAPAPAENPTPTSRFQSLRNLLGTGIRIGSGFLSSEGGPLGFGIGAVGEGLAEAAEGSLNWHTPARMGAEGLISAVPLAKTLEAGRAIMSAGKSMALAGGGDVGRQWAEGNFSNQGSGWDKRRTAIASLVGGVTGGAAGYLTAVPAPPTAKPPIIENMGGGVPRTAKRPGASVPAGTKTFSAGASERGTDAFTPGVSEIHGYEPRPAVPTAPASGSMLEQMAVNQGSRKAYEFMRSKGVSHEAAMAKLQQIADRRSAAGTAPAAFDRTPYPTSGRYTDVAETAAPEEAIDEAGFSNAFAKLLEGKIDAAGKQSRTKTLGSLDEAIDSEAKQAALRRRNVTPFEDEKAAFSDDFAKSLSSRIDAAGKQARTNTLGSLDEAIDAEAKQAAMRSAAREKRVATENALDMQFQDAVRNKHAAMDDEEAAALIKEYEAKWAKEDLEKAKLGKVEQPQTVTETISSKGPGGKTERATRRWANPEEDDIPDGVGVPVNPQSQTDLGVYGDYTEAAAKTASPVGALKQALSPKLPKDIKKMVTTYLDERGQKDFNDFIITGEAPRAAYKKAYELQGKRMARQGGKIPDPTAVPPSATAQPKASPPSTPAPAAPKAAPKAGPLSKLKALLLDEKGGTLPMDAEDVRNSAHPSLFDDGFEGLEDANDALQRQQSTHPSFYDDGFDNLDEVLPKNVKVPPAAQAKLDEAAKTYPPEVMDELLKHSAIYNDPNATKAARDAAGKQLGRISRFMSGKGPLNPKGERGAASIEALLSLGLGTGGAAFGATQDPDNPLEGALIGGATGAALPYAPKIATELGREAYGSTLSGKAVQAGKNIVSKIPQWQRFSLLMDPVGLPANAWAGPYGSVVTGALEGMAKGDPRAWQLLKSAWNPVSFVKNAAFSKSNWDEAYDVLAKGELGREGFVNNGQRLTNFDHLTLAPGWAMTAGDLHARRLLAAAGYSPEEARAITMTGEPAAKLTHGIANFGKGSWLGNMLMPFKRTPANILESGIERTPFLGSFADKLLNTKNGPYRTASWRDQMAEQLGGAIAGYGSYKLAENIDDDGSVTNRGVRRFVSNAAGRYSLPASIGYLLGTANAHGRSMESVIKDPNTATQIFPLPTAEPIKDLVVEPLFGSSQRPPGSGPVSTAIGHIPNSLDLRALRSYLTPDQPVVPFMENSPTFRDWGFDQDLADQRPRGGMRRSRKPRKKS